MANSWNGPQLGSPIRTDVPELQKKLIALLKQDPTSVANIPSGAKRLVNTSGVQWQIQQYNGSSWAAIGKLMHDVDKLDGYHAAITPNANTVAVRNADKKLEGDITGNADTASSAATLSETLPVNKGGTGATTSAQARTNLGVPPTSHASSSTTYGLATDTNYGHVRSDGDTTNIVAGEVVVKDVAIRGDSSDLASGRGQIGHGKYLNGIEVNIDEVVKPGRYRIYNTKGTSKGTWPQNSSSNNYIVIVDGQNTIFSQKFINEAGEIFVRTKKDTTPWGEFNTFVRKADIADVVRTDDIADVVRTSGIQTIAGEKTFTTAPYVQGTSPNWLTVATDYDRLATPAVNNDSFIVAALDKNNERVAALFKRSLTSGITQCSIIAYKQGVTDNIFAAVSSCIDRDGKKWGEAPTPSADSNTNHIATTEWVRDNIEKIVSQYVWSYSSNYAQVATSNGKKLTIQWGITGNLQPEGNYTTVNYNLPFSTVFQVIVVNSETSNQYGDNASIDVKNVSNTGFSIKNLNESATCKARWIAFGVC